MSLLILHIRLADELCCFFFILVAILAHYST
jgi:hypothetical protein